MAFLADWCPFCQEFLPEFARMGPTVPLGLLVADLSSFENPLWEQFEIAVVPTVIIFRDGRVTARFDGRQGEGLDRAALDAIRDAATEASSVDSG